MNTAAARLVRLKKLSYYAPTGRVHVLSPCKGHDADLEENLRALLTQDYPDYEVTFIVEDAGDPACPVIRRAMAACPQAPARLLIAGRAKGCGQKVHNLRMATAGLSPEIRHLAFFDSDSCPKPFWVRAAIYKHYLPHIGATTGYRWLVPQRPTAANHLVSAINCNVMTVLGRDSHQFVWGGSWAIRRETFEQLAIHEAWDGMLSDDLVASNLLRRAGLEVRFDPACVLTSPVDFDWSGMFDFVRRQYHITRHYAFHWWLLALAAATVGNLAWIASLGLLACAAYGQRSSAWPGTMSGTLPVSTQEPSPWSWSWSAAALPMTVLAVLYGLGLYRGWAMQSLAGVYSPEHLAELRGVRRWHVWASPAVVFVQWLGLIASAFGNRVKWRAIDYRLGAGGRVLSTRILAAPENEAEATGVEGRGRRAFHRDTKDLELYERQATEHHGTASGDATCGASTPG